MPLLLLPNLIHDDQVHDAVFAPEVKRAVETLDGLICETEKVGRHYLMALRPETFRTVIIHTLNEHTDEADKDRLLNMIAAGGTWGLISDAGLPCLADPGYDLIRRAHKSKIAVTAYPGPSAIVQALMLSGLPSQRFAFHGYLTRKDEQLRPELLKLEKQSVETGQTHVFIEPPYRTAKMLKALLAHLTPSTELSVVFNVGSPAQGVMTATIAEWKHKHLPDLHKVPTVFLFFAPRSMRRSQGPMDKRRKDRFFFKRRRPVNS